MTMRLTFCCILLALLGAAATSPVLGAQAALSREPIREEALLNNLLPYQIIAGQEPYGLAERMAHYHVPGVGLAVIENFTVVWSGQLGTRLVGNDLPVDSQTLFGMGSLSKAVCSACVLNLDRQGRVVIDRDINPQLTSWQLPPHPWADSAPVTPALLMNHSGGLPHRAPHVYPADGMPTALDMVMGRQPSRQPPLAVTMQPGTTFQYSNGGFTVLQILTEDVTGLDFPAAVRERIFLPLDMKRATFANPLPDDLLDNAAFGHRRDGRVNGDQRHYIAHMAAGGLWTTATDYARFIIEVQKAAAGRSNAIMDQDQARRMITPGPAVQYGLGVFLYEGNGDEPYFSHIGDGAGFVAGFTAHRDLGFGAVITTNGAGGINLCREFLRSVARARHWPGYLPETREELPLPVARRQLLAGRYLADFDQVVQLVDDGERLVMERAGAPAFTLFQVGRDTFVVEERKGEVVVDDSGPRPVLRLHLSDDIGRLGQDLTLAPRMDATERSPLERLVAGQDTGQDTGQDAGQDKGQDAGEEASAFQPYLELSRTRADHPALSENRFNRLGYQYLRQEKLAEALRVFKLNTLLHPDSGNVFDSYGEALLAAGRRDEARSSYRRSLELNPGNGNALKVLQEMDQRE